MRYFLTLAYRGTRYVGWQRQPNGISVQETLETALSTIVQQPLELTGCGRTDAGVHARFFVAHTDLAGKIPATLLNGLNRLLPEDIAVYAIRPVHSEAHARYDAFERSYEYTVMLRKAPFATDTAWFYPHSNRLDRDKMQAVAGLLPQFSAFFPFCKTHSGVEHYDCIVSRSEWVFDPGNYRMVFHITANRFLRGMVRLITGACMQAGLGQLGVHEIQEALEQQIPLRKSLSVPPQGLALTAVKYPYPL